MRHALAVVCVLIGIYPIHFASAQAEESLASKVVDPSAPLTAVTVQDRLAFTRWGTDAGQNEVDLQPILPWQSFGHLNIFRILLPYITDNPIGFTGLGTVQAFNVTVLPRGRDLKLLLGIIFQFAPDHGQESGTFGMGPVLGGLKKVGEWNFGVLNQNIFGSHLSSSQFQPIVTRTLGPKVSAALGDLQYIYDWEAGRWVSLPIGAQLNYIATLGKQPIRLFVNPQYNFRDLLGAPQFSTTLGIAVLLVK